MALQIRRGLAADLPASPADGELLYATDTNDLYIGNDGSAQPISSGGGSGLANVVEDTSPQLGGDLDVNGHKIVTTGNGNIEIDPGGNGDVILHGNLIIDQNSNISKIGQLNISPTTLTSFGNNNTLTDGNVYITRNTYSSNFANGFYFAQHHDTVDATNFTFYRSRGTGLSPTAVQTGDDLADISFIGWDGTGRASGAAISATVDNVPTTGNIPTKLSFATNNGSIIAVRAELTSAGIWKVDNIQNHSGTELTLTATTIRVAGDVQINAQGDLRFADSDSSNYVAFQAPATVATNITWTLPSTDGSSGQVLSTNGAGTLSWATTSSGSGLSSRTTKVGSTTSIADGATDNIIITGFKSYVLYKIQTSHAAWVRLYSSVQARTDDSARLEGTDPAAGAGVIAEVITTGAQTLLISPGVIGFNSELVTTTEIPCAVTNKSGSAAIVSVTLTVLQIEV